MNTDLNTYTLVIEVSYGNELVTIENASFPFTKESVLNGKPNIKMSSLLDTDIIYNELLLFNNESCHKLNIEYCIKEYSKFIDKAFSNRTIIEFPNDDNDTFLTCYSYENMFWKNGYTEEVELNVDIYIRKCF